MDQNEKNHLYGGMTYAMYRGRKERKNWPVFFNTYQQIADWFAEGYKREDATPDLIGRRQENGYTREVFHMDYSRWSTTNMRKSRRSSNTRELASWPTQRFVDR